MHNVRPALSLVFHDHPHYRYVAALYAIVFYGIANLIPNYGILKFAYLSPTLTITDKWAFLGAALTFVVRSVSMWELALFFSVLIVTGLVGAMGMFLIRRKVTVEHAAGTSILGIFVGIIGVGCGACGSVVLTSVVGLAASTQIINVLPLKGIEFTLISIALLLFTLVFLSKKLTHPDVCLISPSRKK